MRPSKVSKSEPRHDSFGVFLVLLALGVVGRLVPHPPNMTPVGASAIWGGARLDKKWSYLLVIAIMVVTDLFLGFDRTLPYVYGSLLLNTWLASHIKRASVFNIAGMTLLGAVIFFLVTNFGGWIGSPLYPQTLTGLMASYVAAIPFFRLSLVGDIGYTAVFFGAEYAVLTWASKKSMLRQAK